MNKRSRYCKIAGYLITLVFIASIFAPFLGAIPPVSAATENWWNTGWPYRRPITINPSSVSADQVDFPVLVDLVDGSLVGKVQGDGDDFVFVNTGGIKLDHEIELYDSAVGHLIAWVKIPFLSSSLPTTIYLYYGNLASPNQRNPQAVWDTNYKLVLHLGEPAGVNMDSTVNGNNAIAFGGAGQGVLGKIGGAVSFDGINDYLQVDHSADLTGFETAFTASFWVKLTDTSRRQTFLNKYVTTDNQRAWSIDYESSRGLGLFTSQNGQSYRYYYASFNPTANIWYYISVVWLSGQTPLFFINGVSTPVTFSSWTAYSSIFNNVGIPLDIGRCTYETNRYLAGLMDEVSISSTQRSSEYLLTSYRNQADPSTFCSVGPEEGLMPSILNENPSDGAVDVPISLSELRFDLLDTKGGLLSYTVVTSPDIGSGSANNVPSGSYSVSISGLASGTMYSWTVEVTDGIFVTSKTYHFTTMAASGAPIHSDPLLVSSSGINLTNDYLICSNQSTADPDGDKVTNIYNWYKNDVSLTNLLMPFDLNNPATAKDYSGYTKDGVIQGAIWTNEGVVGGAYNFDGNDLIRVSDSATLDGNGAWSQLTIEFWVRTDAPLMGTRLIAKKAATASTGSYMVGFQTSSPSPPNTVFAGVTIGGRWYDIWDNTATVLASNTWYHVVATYQSGPGITIYINGVPKANRPLTGLIDSGNDGEPLFIGSSGQSLPENSNRYLRGSMDEVRIYPFALTPEQIFQRYMETKDGLSSSSVIVPQETRSEISPEVWKCAVTPNDGLHDGATKFSNSIALAEPCVLNESPRDLTTRVPISTATLSFDLVDLQGDRLSYTVTTSPNIGSKSQNNVPPGRYSVPINGLKAGTFYIWTVYVTDGIHATTKTFQFSTPFITQKWVRTGLASGFSGVITANLDNDPYEEVIMAGEGAVMCLDGQTGTIQWTYSNPNIGFFCQPQMADLDNDGEFEIIVPIQFPPAVVALRGDNGAVWWQISLSGGGREGSITSSPVVADIDGNGHPTIFVGREDAIEPFNGGIAAISWDGQIIAETWAYRPCSGGFSLADVNNDGVFELFMGDRASPGDGARALNAHNLQPLWSRPDILCSSHCPLLADVTGDGTLDVIVENQRNRIYVLDALTGATIRQTASMDMPGHYQPVIHDIDGDGNLEIILADGEHDNTPSYILIWDLVAWKEDARIDVGLCVYPPQLGDVTGDGKMDIIACNYTGIFIISFNQQSGKYDIVDQITNLAGWLTYAVVQDIDNDGLNEIVVQSMGRRVYVFDTIAPRPTLRARSEVQFYSERRLGASEWVPPP